MITNRIKAIYSTHAFSTYWVFSMCLIIVCHTLLIPPHFDDLFCVWKVIMGESQTYTRNYNYSNDLLLLQYVFQWLYAWRPDFSWLPGFFIISGVFSFLCIQLGVLFFMNKRGYSLITSIYVNVFLFFIYEPNLSLVHHNRTAFIISSAGLFWYFLCSTDLLVDKSVKFLRYMALLWFIIGLLCRPEASIAALVVFSPLTFLNGKIDFFHGFKSFVAPASFVGIFLLYYFYQITFSTAFYYQLEPNVEYAIMDRQQVVSLSDMNSRIDSARHMASTRWMLGDVKQTSPSFLRRVISEDDLSNTLFFLLPPKRSVTVIYQVINELFEILSGYVHILLLLIWLILMPFFQPAVQRRMVLLFIFLLALILLVFSINIRTYPRVVEPFIFCVSVSMVAYYIMVGSPVKTSLKSIVLGSVLLILGTPFLSQEWQSRMVKAIKASKDEIQLRENIQNHIVNETNRHFVAVLGNWDVFNTGLFMPFTGFGNKTLLLIELGQYSANPEFLETINNRTGCQGYDFTCRIDFLKRNRKDIIFVATPQRVDLYRQYMQMMYDFDFDIRSSKKTLLSRETYAWFPTD